jgi:hypothetical protein
VFEPEKERFAETFKDYEQELEDDDDISFNESEMKD